MHLETTGYVEVSERYQAEPERTLRYADRVINVGIGDGSLGMQSVGRSATKGMSKG